MSSKGQRGNCIYNRQWELNSKYKGWLTAFKADRKQDSCDGTWQRRGFSFLNGCVTAISMDTRKILDVLSKVIV